MLTNLHLLPDFGSERLAAPAGILEMRESIIQDSVALVAVGVRNSAPEIISQPTTITGSTIPAEALARMRATSEARTSVTEALTTPVPEAQTPPAESQPVQDPSAQVYNLAEYQQALRNVEEAHDDRRVA
jgi:hypothetical protein